MSKKITELPSLSATDPTDVFVVVDVSAGTTKHVTQAGTAAAVVSSIANGSIGVALMTTDANPETRLSESLGDFFKNGTGLWTATTGLAATRTQAIVYIGGRRVISSAVASHTFTASKDTYVSTDNTGAVTYTEVANNAASPTLPAGAPFWGAIVVTDATTVQVINQGQLSATGPTVSSRILLVADTKGQLIYPKAGQKEISYAPLSSDFTTASTSDTQVTQGSIPILMPTGNMQEVEIQVDNIVANNNTATQYVSLSLWLGTVGSGTLLSRKYWVIPNATGLEGAQLSAKFTPPAGLSTINLGVQVQAGNGGFKAYAGGFLSARLA